METRMEHFAKYRNDIRMMSDADFEIVRLTPEQKEQLFRAVSPQEAASKVTATLERERGAAPNLNEAFLKRRHRLWVIQGVIGGILLIVFLIWGLLLWRSK